MKFNQFCQKKRQNSELNSENCPKIKRKIERRECNELNENEESKFITRELNYLKKQKLNIQYDIKNS